MTDMTPARVHSNANRQQRSRIFRVATLGAAVFIHLVICWTVLSVGYMDIGIVSFLGLASVSAAGFLFLALLISFEWNLGFEDPDLALPQMLWSITVVILTTHFVNELKPAVLLSGLALVVLGTNRLSRREQMVFACYGLGLYAMSVFYTSQVTSMAWLTESVVMVAFGLLLVFGPMLYRFEAGVMESVLIDKNQELTNALERIRELAVRDELTGAYNRRYVMDFLLREKALADRGGHCFTVCYVDLDFFKRVNDRFGHSAGDHVLQGFSDIAVDLLREVDCVARMGGEEFLLVLSGTRQQAALIAAERLAEKLKGLVVSQIEPGYRITASIGITEYRAGEEVHSTLDRADKALYDAKRTGRNKFVIAEMPEQLSIG